MGIGTDFWGIELPFPVPCQKALSPPLGEVEKEVGVVSQAAFAK
jgi:hypothetical protein